MRSCPDSPTGPFSRSPISHRLHGSPDTLPTTYKTTHRASSTVCFAIRILKTIASEDSEGKLIVHEERHSCDLNWHHTQAHFDSWESASAQASHRRSA